MILKCITAFGNFKPGDVVEVPDGAEFDKSFFEAVEEQDEEKDAE